VLDYDDDEGEDEYYEDNSAEGGKGEKHDNKSVI
jgi:hypothetical protein